MPSTTATRDISSLRVRFALKTTSMPDSEEKLFSDKHSDPGFTEFDEEMVSWISTNYKHLKDMFWTVEHTTVPVADLVDACIDDLGHLLRHLLEHLMLVWVLLAQGLAVGGRVGVSGGAQEHGRQASSRANKKQGRQGSRV